MQPKKNFGPCSVVNCEYKNVCFRTITELAYQKCHNNHILEAYSYLEIGKQLCHPHYCSIIEPNRGQKRKKKSKNQDSRKRVACEGIESSLIEETGKSIMN
jgi:hypothetical protein